MNETRPLYKLFRVGERFQRSVNIAADYGNPQALDDYILTSLSKAVVSRVAAGLRATATGRAWSITGPYGAGKSAAVLFLSEILGFPKNRHALTILKSSNPELSEELHKLLPGLDSGGFIIVPLVGSREPITWTLLAGLIQRLTEPDIDASVITPHLCVVKDLYVRAKNGEPVPTASVMEALQACALALQTADPQVLGLLIIYDELGKALEYAALHPEHSDVGILQTLAELAARSQEIPIGLITVLHQAFERYAAGLNPVQQREWAKVQGRFEDIGFLESPGELLSLIDKAIYNVEPVGNLGKVVASEVERGEKLGLLPRDLDPQVAQRVLAGCAPLHPTVSLVLGRLFRSRLSQNERSLFAFLSSGEPYGFQEHLGQEVWDENASFPFYRLDNLYDYVLAAMGSVLYTQAQGKKWAEMEDALDRLPKNANAVDAKLIKAIGLLGLLGDQHYLKASEDVLVYGFSNDGTIGADAISKALSRLEDAGIAVYRRFKDAYSLWQGSDIDLNERFEQGWAQIDRSKSLAAQLQSRGQVKPYVAKRHLHETGTFRYFVPWIIDLENLDEVAQKPFGAADGAVVFVLGTNGTPMDTVIARVRQFSADLEPFRSNLTFFAIPKGIQGIREAFEETLAWEWVAQNTPELEGDSIARRELAARHLAAQEHLDRASARCFETAHSFRACAWVRTGSEQQFESARSLSAAISDVCDLVYKDAPIVKNELVNRRKLSSAAAAARRNLIEQMLTHSSDAKLGIESYPPEMSIYLSVLKSSGLHHQQGDRWVFGPPTDGDPYNVLPLWQAIDAFLTTTEEGQRPVGELYDLLRKPPFGIKDGLLPIYLIVALLHWRAALAVYEEGNFVPEVGPAECERLMRVPQRFSLRRYQLDESRALMLFKYSTLFGEEIDPGQVDLLTAVRPVLAFAKQLPQYTLLTQSLSGEAIKVRETLFSAREPQGLLFATLPQALDLERVDHDLALVEPYFSKLKRILLELQRAYEQLLVDIQKQLINALLLPSDLEAARQEIAHRCGILEDWVADLRLKAFIMRLGDTKLLQREWLESVAAGLTNKPPKQWNDGDKRRYHIALVEAAGQFRRIEEIALDETAVEQGADGSRIIRLGLTDTQGYEQRVVVRIASDQEDKLEKTVDALQEMLQEYGPDQKTRVMAIAELARRVLEPRPMPEEHDE